MHTSFEDLVFVASERNEKAIVAHPEERERERETLWSTVVLELRYVAM